MDDKAVPQVVHLAEEHILKLLPDVFAEVWSLVVLHQICVLAGGAERVVDIVPVLLEGEVCSLLCCVIGAYDLIQHFPLQHLCPVRMFYRGIAGRVCQLDDQDGRFCNAYITGRMLEVELGCSLHAVGGVAEVRFVQVHLQNLVLGQVLLKLECPPELNQLSFYSLE